MNPVPMSRNIIARFRWVLVAVAAALLVVPLAVHAQSGLAAPDNLTATIGDEQLILDWADPGNSNITKYQISTDGGLNFINVECRNSMATRHTATGLTNGTSYTFQVRAYDDSGPGASATVTATPLLPAPTELVAWPGDGYVQLRWKESTDSRITGYEVNHEGTYYRVTDQGHESETFGYSIYKLADGQTDLANGTNYTIKVRAVNGKAATLNATPVIPAISIRATPGYGWVTLSWRDRGDSRIKGYQFSSDDGANYTSVASTDLVSYKVNNLDFLKYKFTGLTNGTSYTFKVRAEDAADTVIGAVSPPDTEQYDPLTATPLFLAPSNLTAAPGVGQVTLSWDDPETTEISKYQLKIDSGAFADITGSNDTTTSHTVENLTNYTSHTFELRAYDSSAAGPSSEVIAYSVAGPTVPPPPDNLVATAKATPAGGQVTLTWDDPGNAAITGYDVSSDGGINYTSVASGSTDLVDNSEDNTIEYTITGLTNWKEGGYTFTVRAVNASGAGAPSKAWAEPGVVPGDVGNLTATPKHERVELTWNDPTTHDRNDGYKFRYKKTNDAVWGEWKSHHNPGGTKNELTIYELTNSESHDFQLLAFNYIGDGPTSELTTTPVPTLPLAPTNLVAARGDGEVTLTWTDTRDDEVITNYHISSDNGTNYTSFSTVVSYSDTTTVSYTVRSLTNGTKYTFKVKAQNSAGIGPPPDSGVEETPLFAAPKGLQASPGGRQVTLTWDNPGDSSITGYELSIDGGDFAAIDDSAAATSHTMTELDGSTEKTFAVRAVYGVAATVSATPLFASPADLTALVGDQQITLNWTNPGNTNINGYEVSSDNGTNYTPISLSDDTTNTHIVQNLTNGTEYSFAVRAVNCPANGVAETVEATPLFAAPTGLTATAGYGEVMLGWDNPANNNISGYEVSSDGGNSYTSVASGSTDLVDNSEDNTIEYTVTGLAGGTSYTFAVRAVNGAAATVSETPLFAAPTGLTATAGYGEVMLGWDNPANNNISGYEVSSDGGNSYTSVASGSTDLIYNSEDNTIEYTVTGLAGGTSYTFAVRAVNGAAATVSETPLFAAPTGLTAEAGDGQVKLIWTNPLNSNITGYELSIDSDAFADILGSDAATTSHAVTGLTNGTLYTFAVQAENGAAAMVTATPLFAAPENLSAAPGDRQVTLTWEDPENTNISKYQLKIGNGAFADIPNSDATTTSHTVTGLTNGETYTFAVQAVNGAAAMVDGTPVGQDPPPPPPVPGSPGNLTATPYDRAIALRWTAAANNGSPIIKYQHRRSGGEWEDVPGGPTATGVTVSGLSNGVEYVFYVRAVSSAGTGAQASVSGTPAAAPDAPGNLTATPDNRAVALSWTAAANNGSPITKYQHRRSDVGWEDVPGGPTATGVTVSGLSNGVEYVFYVRAVSGAGAGAEASVSATPAAAPDAPGNLTATPDNRAVALSWTAAANNGSPITKYQHRRSDVGWQDVPGGPNATGVTASGLTNGVEYVFYVRAVSSAGAGAQASVSATPAAAPEAPGNLTATPDNRAVALSWTAAADNGSLIIKYQHSRLGVEWADVPGGPNATEVTVSGLVNDTRYTFSVRAVNGMGEGAVASVTAAPQADLADSGPGETPVPTPEPPPTPKPEEENTDGPTPTPTPERTQQVVRAIPAAPQQVILATPTPEPARTPVATATMVPLSAGGAVAATPTAAPVTDPTPQPTATQIPALRVRVTPKAPIEPAARPIATPAGTPLREARSGITDFPVAPVGIGLFAVLIAALATLLLALRRRS